MRKGMKTFRQENLTGLTALGVAEEKICDCVGDGEAWRLFEPEEFARRIEFEKDVFAVRMPPAKKFRNLRRLFKKVRKSTIVITDPRL